MKKNISVISMDSVLQEWLLQKLIKEPPDSDSAKELLSGIYDMVSGEINSLLLSTANNSEIASLNLSDEMKIGEVVINPKSRSVTRMGQAVSLTPKEFDILYFLAENRCLRHQKIYCGLPYSTCLSLSNRGRYTTFPLE